MNTKQTEALNLALDALDDPSILNGVNNSKFFIKQALAEQEQDACGWQFYAGGKWHTGMEVNDHRASTEAAGIPTRNVYPGPVVQLAQQPVGVVEYSLRFTDGFHVKMNRGATRPDTGASIYTAPPQRPWVGLTEEDIQEAWLKISDWRTCMAFVEDKLKRKNT